MSKGITASSAGTTPANKVNPFAIEVMKGKGIDISGSKPKANTEQTTQDTNVVVLTDSTLENSISKNIQKKSGKKLVEWSVTDPRGLSIGLVKFIGNNIEKELNSPLSQKDFN